MKNPWNNFAEQRQKILSENQDITFDKILFPEIVKYIFDQENYSSISLIDVGCFTGHLAIKIAEHVKVIHGIDPSPNAIDIAKKSSKAISNISFSCISIEDYSLRNTNKYDFAISHMVAQVVENIDIFFNSISHILNTNGKFLFSIPHPAFWAIIKEDIGKGEYQYIKESYHINDYKLGDQHYVEVPYYHRPLQVYSELLYNNNFVIEKISEPFPNSSINDMYKRPWFYPGFIFFLCKKDIGELK